jgi:flagellar M-ring protein FliF
MLPGSRMAAGLLAVSVLLGLVYLGTRQAPGPDADLMHGAPVAASQLPAMVSALAKANLKGYEIRGTSIMVPRGQEPAYLAALADAQALPLGFGDVLRKAVDAGNLFEGREQREQRTKIALQEVLAGIVRSMTGIESACVLYDIDNRPGGFKEKLITATVSVKPAGSAQLDEERVSAIRHFVAGAIAGLKPENVTVSDLNSRTWYGKVAGDRGAEENLCVSLKRTYEQDLKAKILNALCFIPNVTAEVSIVLDRQQITRLKQAKQTPGNQLGRGGSAVRPNAAAMIGAPPGDTRDENETPDREGPAPLSAGLTPISARVSVGVPASYLKKVWRERHPDPPGQDAATPAAAALDQIGVEKSAKIRRHVAQLLPPTQTTAEQVTVTTFEDLQTPAPPPGAAQQAWSWLAASWRTVGVTGLALVCLLWFWSAVRGGRAGGKRQAASISGEGWQAASTSPEAGPAEDDAWQQASRVPPPHWRAPRGHRREALVGRGRPADPVIHRQLSELVEADPETAAGILRNWIGHAS